MSNRPDPTMTAPEGFHFEPAVEGDDWRVATWSKKLCRYMVGGRSCKRPAVAELNRSHSRRRDNWWAYCDNPVHLFGRWIEDGQVMHWRLVEDDGRTSD